MAGFIKLTTPKREEVMVNIEHITYYYSFQRTTCILLINGKSLEVMQSAEEISRLISHKPFAMAS